ncbi:MAG: YciI family protein [Acidimicrobiia bacterium]|nr:YciI family protein [Acidimicrobiia bacterium]
MAGDTQQFLYHFQSGDRPQLATDPSAWTDDDNQVGADHFAYLQAAAADGVVVMAGRSQDGIGPAIVIIEAVSEEEARAFMEADPFVESGLFTASLHPFRIALQRETEAQ